MPEMSYTLPTQPAASVHNQAVLLPVNAGSRMIISDDITEMDNDIGFFSL
jgi:hypothetical protein